MHTPSYAFLCGRVLDLMHFYEYVIQPTSYEPYEGYELSYEKLCTVMHEKVWEKTTPE